MNKVCAYCGRTFQVRFPRNKNLYCSKLCSNRANALPAERNPAYKPKIDKTCAMCGKSYQVRPSEAERNRFCSVQCRIDYTRTLTGDKRYNHKGKVLMACEVCGTQKWVKPAHQLRFRACSKRCASELARRTWPRTSKIEEIMAAAFADANLLAVAQYPIDMFTVDFAFPKHRLAVECDGDYWHSTERQQTKDRQKDGYLKHKGWRVIRLSEANIHADPRTCVALVLSLIR